MGNNFMLIRTVMSRNLVMDDWSPGVKEGADLKT